MRATCLFVLAACACAHVSSPPAAPAPVAPVAAASPIAARVGDRAITLEEVDESVKSEIHQARLQSLDRLIDEAVVAQAAARAGKPAAQFVEHLAAERVRPVTRAEAEQFFERNKASLPEQLANKSFSEIAPILIQGLTDEKRQEAVRAILAELRAKTKVEVVLEPPRIDVAATGPTRGGQTAKVTIIEFSDFQCPYCARAQPVLQQLLDHYGDKVRLVFRDYPLAFHGDAARAAEAGHCADELGKFWALHDWMFENQHSLSQPELEEAAPSLGIDRARFTACLDSGKYRDAVMSNFHDGEKAGVSGTPAFFINGVLLKGSLPFEQFQTVIDRALSH